MVVLGGEAFSYEQGTPVPPNFSTPTLQPPNLVQVKEEIGPMVVLGGEAFSYERGNPSIAHKVTL